MHAPNNVVFVGKANDAKKVRHTMRTRKKKRLCKFLKNPPDSVYDTIISTSTSQTALFINRKKKINGNYF